MCVEYAGSTSQLPGTVMASHFAPALETAAAFVVNCHWPLSDCCCSPPAATDKTDATNIADVI